MKRSVLFIAVISIAAASCTTQKQMTSAVNDDVYYTPERVAKPAVVTAPQSGGAQVVTAPDQATANKPASSTLTDDNNDYSYSSRIKRFSSTDTTKGYYDESYTGGSSYSNDNNPDINVYLGAGYGAFSPYFSFGFGYGYPYYGFYDPWYYPYYGWGYPHYYGWGNPYYGWYDPWYNPCYFCYNDWYPNSNYSNHYYGARNIRSGGDGTGSRPVRTSPMPGSSDQVASRSSVSPNGSGNVAARERTAPASRERYRYTPPSGNRQPVYQRSEQQASTQRTGNSQVQNQGFTRQPSPRYAKPGSNDGVQRSGSVQNYTSPVYRQPKSSQEYLGNQGTGTIRSGADQGASRSGSGQVRQGSSPSGNRSFTVPSRSGTSGTQTPRSNYSAPSRSGGDSYTAPSRSGGSNYSAPSRSGGSNYSAPSRSGGNSSPSGGSSGSGRRR